MTFAETHVLHDYSLRVAGLLQIKRTNRDLRFVTEEELFLLAFKTVLEAPELPPGGVTSR